MKPVTPPESISDDSMCYTPIAAHYSVASDGAIASDFEMGKITAEQLADFLIRKFGIDVE